MRALVPTPSDTVDLEAMYAVGVNAPSGHPFVRINMISSLDGAIAVNGRSGLLGGTGDREVFHVLRSLADVILVGAGTARAEGYGPARTHPEVQDRRRARGQTAAPSIAVVTRSCDLDWSAPFFTEAQARPVVVTTSTADDSARARAAAAADVIVAGTGDVDMGSAVDALGERGARHVLVEGGPGLNAQLVAAGLMDELCLTLSPRLVGGAGSR